MISLVSGIHPLLLPSVVVPPFRPERGGFVLCLPLHVGSTHCFHTQSQSSMKCEINMFDTCWVRLHNTTQRHVHRARAQNTEQYSPSELLLGRKASGQIKVMLAHHTYPL